MTGEASSVCSFLAVNLQQPRSERNHRKEAEMGRHKGSVLAQTLPEDSRKGAVMASRDFYFLDMNISLYGMVGGRGRN